MNKVLLASFQRCGTQSATKFLESRFGRSIQFSPVKGPEYFLGKDLAYFREHSRAYETNFSVFSNAPYFALYEEFYKDYPSMKFVLITRNQDDWLRSFKALTKVIGIDTFSMACLAKYLPNVRELYRTNLLGDKELLDIYNMHNSSVIDFFKDKENFFHGDLNDSEIGNRLDTFLETSGGSNFEKIDNTNIYSYAKI